MLKRMLAFAVNFSVSLSVVALPIVPKVEVIFKIILFITIFFTKVQEAVLNPGYKSLVGNQINPFES